MKSVDYWSMGLITLVFTILVFFRLGNFTSPESLYWTAKEERDIVLDFGENTGINHLSIYLGPLDNRSFTVSAYNENDSQWELISEQEVAASVFTWNQIPITHNLRYLSLASTDEEALLGELIIVADDGSVLLPVNCADYSELFDEQDTFTSPKTYLSGTIFDEIYHGRTAYEFIHGLTTYETTHPPLGKIFISLGIRLFGMTPFGWRFVPALFGILMVPLFYLFGKALFRNTLAATAVTILLAADCMHYALSRIATIDIIAAFFIVLMYFLLFLFFLADQRKLAKLSYSPYLPLGLCGITMGIAVAVKWTGVYAGVGLCLLFFWYLIRRQPSFKETISLIGFCLVFFCLIPILIYVLSYLPFVENTPSGSLLQTVLNNMQYMLSYHSTLEATHYYSTPFYEWPLLRMPLLYATDRVTETTVSSISCMGNPIIWWCGIPFLLFAMYRWTAKSDTKAGFLVIAYLAQYLPWFFIGRITFIYHYFPSSLFLILTTGYVLDLLARSFSWGKKAVAGYLLITVLVFLLFFPVVSGLPATLEYEMGLRLLDQWILAL